METDLGADQETDMTGKQERFCLIRHFLFYTSRVVW